MQRVPDAVVGEDGKIGSVDVVRLEYERAICNILIARSVVSKYEEDSRSFKPNNFSLVVLKVRETVSCLNQS